MSKQISKTCPFNYSKVLKNLAQTKYFPWIILLLCAFILFYKYLLSVSPSAMTSELMKSFNINGVGLGNIGAAFYYTYTVVQLFVGILLDRYSPRLLASFSLAVSALGALIFSQAHFFSTALIARGLMGFGAAFATVTYLKMAALWFRPNQLAFVSGLLATAVMVGAVCGVAPLSNLVGWIGWRSSLWIIALFGFILAACFLLFVKTPDSLMGANICSNKNEQGNQSDKIEKITFKHVRQIFGKSQNILLVCYNGLAFVPLTIFAGLWGNPFLCSKYSLSSAKSGWLLSFIFIGLGVGAPLLGLLSDYLGRRRLVMFWGILASLISVLIITYVPGLPIILLISMLFLFGFSTGAFMLVFSVGREMNPLALCGIVVAFINTGELLNSVTEPLIGKILDIFWDGTVVNGAPHFSTLSYQYAFVLLPIYLFLGLVILYFIREPQKID